MKYNREGRCVSNRFSIVVPVYQNEENLPETVHKLLKVFQQVPSYEAELIFVDDGSTDRSLQILTDYTKRYPETIKVVKLTRNFGQNPAIQAGLRHATGACVGIISADLQEPCELFLDMIKAWECGARLVIGERQSREENRLHQLTSGVYWYLIRRFAFADYPPMGFDFCLLDRQVVEDINRINEKNSPILVLIYWLGYRPVRLSITRKQRDKGSSQWRLWNKIGFTMDTLIGFTYLPARLITVTGLGVATLSLLYLFFMVIQWYRMQTAPPGWMTVVGLLTLLGAAILFSIGIVSEYLLRILDEARKRPPYVVESVIGKTDESKLHAGVDTRPASV